MPQYLNKYLTMRFVHTLGASKPSLGGMRGAQDRPRNLRDQSCQENEEHELDRIETQPVTPSSTSAPPRIIHDNESRAQRRSSTGKARPPHIHYVPIEAARDHLANERVFLAYIRTSSALANFAVAILQLYRLQHNASPNRLSDYDLGVPVATVTLFMAIAVTLAGVWRFFACQNAMALRKQIVTSGRVVLVFIPLSILLLLVLFVFTIVTNPDI